MILNCVQHTLTFDCLIIISIYIYCNLYHINIIDIATSFHLSSWSFLLVRWPTLGFGPAPALMVSSWMQTVGPSPTNPWQTNLPLLNIVVTGNGTKRHLDYPEVTTQLQSVTCVMLRQRKRVVHRFLARSFNFLYPSKYLVKKISEHLLRICL